jgi:hypothetical protein
MNELIEKNRALLHSYYTGDRTIGWLLLITAIVLVVMKSFSGFSGNQEHRLFMTYLFCQEIIVGYVLLALILLGLAQFVRYLCESEYQPGLILRYGDKILYLYALGLIVSPILHYYFQMKAVGYQGTGPLFMFMSGAMAPAVARALIFAGMAKVLKRMVPMIEESKTLV